MGLQLVHGIIGRAHDLDPEFAQQALRGKGVLGELGIAVIVNFAGRRWVQPLVLDAEGTLQLHVRPVVQRIAECVGHGARPSDEFFVRRGIAGDVALVDAVGPQELREVHEVRTDHVHLHTGARDFDRDALARYTLADA